jgi:uncharacterized protein
MKIVTEFPRTVVEHPDMGITMSDGCRLSARIWLPGDAEQRPVPAILEHLPYRKRDGTAARDAVTHPYFAGHGYACIRVDMRGNGDSHGLMGDEYTPQELNDAVEVIAWAAQQPWCTGAVGMMGISWGGFNALQVAALRPPALKAIITLCSTVDRYADDIHFKGGCLLNENLGWGATMLSYSSRPPDPAIVGDQWREMWIERLETMPFFPALWLAHQSRDAYWQHGSVCEDYAAIQAAVLAIGGWHDGYRNTVARLVGNIAAPVKGIVGPWIHKYPHLAAPKPAIGFLQEALRWWDRWLKGIETGVEDDPAYRAWLMDSVRPAHWHPRRPGRWIAETEWPSRAIRTEIIHLTKGRLAPEPEAMEVMVSSPQDCGLMTGEYFPFMSGPELPGDQRADDALSACFDGDPLTDPLDIVGAPAVTLTLQSDKPQANIAIRLCDVHPDGASELISYGVLNLSQRDSRESPEPLPIGQDVAVTVTLDQIAYRIPEWHRLRVAVSTAYWPMIWPSPEAPRLTITSGALALPLRPLAKGDETSFPEPEGAEPWAVETRREESSERRIERDLLTGLVSVVVVNDFGEVRNKDHGLCTGSRMRETWSIHPDDPQSANGEIWWEQTLSRGGWSVRTEATAAMTSDEDAFRLRGHLRAWEGESLVADRAFSETIDRRQL